MNIDVTNRKRGNVPPDIVVIGAMRAGTTTLYEMMRKTGTVSVPRMKETDFFLDRQYRRGLSWLNGQYDDFSKPLVDVSPNYSKTFVFPNVASRIYETNPNAKLVYVLRNPVERAISQFKHLTAMGYELKKPHETEPRIGECVSDASLYYTQLKPYLEYWDMDQIEIVEFEDLVEDQWGTLAALYERLGLPAFTPADTQIHTNSADQLQRVPHWWGQTRNKPFFEWMRSKAPRSAVAAAKAVLFHGQGNKMDTIEFPDAAIDKLKRNLSDDVAMLRQLTGRGFERWSI